MLKMSRVLGFTLCALNSLLAGNASAWSDNSLSFLSGSRYQLTPDNHAEIVTFEHASNFAAGDLFLFIDRFRFDEGVYATYSEFSPRLTLKSYSSSEKSLIKELLLASTWERGSGPGAVSFNHYLWGVGVDFRLPHFRYSKANIYYRDNDTVEDNWQLTLSFALPFLIGKQHFLYDGFLDWTSTTGDKASSMNLTTQLKWELSRSWGGEQKLYAGIEYVFWNNKYGVADRNERNINLLVKYHF